MTLQQLRQVLTIAESNSMNEAAKKLFVSQPNLSATVREVEEELGITVFMRNNRGITVTAEGEEFLGYAKQVVEQYHLLENRYLNVESKKKFSVSMQHYSFAVKAFVQLAKEVGMDEYEFAVHETKTKEVIDNVKNLKSELGVLFLSDFNEKVLRKLFKECDIEFKELFTCNTYVYLWKKHPLAGKKVKKAISFKDKSPVRFTKTKTGVTLELPQRHEVYSATKLSRKLYPTICSPPFVSVRTKRNMPSST